MALQQLRRLRLAQLAVLDLFITHISPLRSPFSSQHASNRAFPPLLTTVLTHQQSHIPRLNLNLLARALLALHRTRSPELVRRRAQRRMVGARGLGRCVIIAPYVEGGQGRRGFAILRARGDIGGVFGFLEEGGTGGNG